MKNKNPVSASVRVVCICHPTHSGSPARRNKNLIRILESFVILPAITLSMPIGGLFGMGLIKTDMNLSPQVALLETRAEVVDEKTQILKERAQAIDSYFAARKMPLHGTGMKFAKEADKHDLDWRLLPAIAVIETTGGKNLCKSLPKEKNKNPFGWGSCKIGFPTFDKAIEVIALNLSGDNPNTAKHYDGKTTKEILEKYNPPSVKPGYSNKVMGVMEAIGKKDVGLTLKQGTISNT